MVTSTTFEPSTFKIGVDTYTLRLGFRAICAVEEELDTGFIALISRMGSGELRIGHIVALFCAMLSTEHPDITRERAEVLMEELGVERAGTLMNEAIEKSKLFATEKSAAKAPKAKAKAG